MYVFDGKINTTKVRVEGINEIKYPIKNNHGSRGDFMQVEIDENIRRGNAIVSQE